MTTNTMEGALRAGVAELGLTLSQEQVTQLLDYQALLQKWNRVYNLTAVRDPQDMLRQHLLDSLAVVPALARELQNRGKTSDAALLDVGAGAGLPGVVIAVCCPDVRVVCVDAVAKKMAFVRQVAVALGLRNLQAVHGRVEQMSDVYDVVCSRAFASLADFVRWSRHLVAPGGSWMAMKGQQPDTEIAVLPPEVQVFHVEHLVVPGLDAQRCIVWMHDTLGANAKPAPAA